MKNTAQSWARTPAAAARSTLPVKNAWFNFCLAPIGCLLSLSGPDGTGLCSAREPDPDPGQGRVPAAELTHRPAQADPEVGVVQGPADGVVLGPGQATRGVQGQMKLFDQD